MAARSERSTAATKKKAPTAPKASAAKPAAKAVNPAKAGAKAAAPPARAAAKPSPRAAKPAEKPVAKPAGKPSKAAPAKAARAPVEAKAVTKTPKVEAKSSKSAKPAAKPVRASREASAPLVAKKPAGKKGEPVSSKKGRHEEEAAAPLRKGDGKKAPAGKKGAPARPVASGSKRPNVDRSPTPPRTVSKPPPRLSLRPPPPPRQPTLEERSASVEIRLGRTSEEFRKAYIERVDMSWIFHDAALEGVVYTEQELRAALDPNAPPVPPESSLKPICDEIRRHREAIEYVRDQATKKRQPVNSDMIKKLYLILHPEEGDLKSVKYRKEVPQHRLYLHEYTAPDKIATKVRQIIDWVNDPETRKTRGSIRIAGRAHFDLLRVFPFPHDSGKVARLFLNLMLMRAGYLPAVIHSTDRQRYYEAVKASAIFINQMVQEAIENSLASIEKLLDEYETRVRSFA